MVQSKKKKTPTKPNPQPYRHPGPPKPRRYDWTPKNMQKTPKPQKVFAFSGEPFVQLQGLWRSKNPQSSRRIMRATTVKPPSSTHPPLRRVSRTAGSPPAVDSVFGWGKGIQGSWLMTSSWWFRNPIPNHLGCSRNPVNYGIFTISTGELNPDVWNHQQISTDINQLTWVCYTYRTWK